jgi:VWFA-related protein
MSNRGVNWSGQAALTAFAVLLVAAFALAQSPPPDPPQHFGERVDVTVIDLLIDVRDAQGNVPPDLKASDFIVLEDGVAQRVIGIEYLREPRTVAKASPEPAATPTPTVAASPARPPAWQLLIYFDGGLLNALGLKNATKSIIESAEKLAELGNVEIVVANPSPKVILAPTRDVAAIREALASVGKQGVLPLTEIQRIRSAWMQEVAGINATGLAVAEEKVAAAKVAAAQEQMVLRRHRDRLLSFLGRYDDRSPKALFLVNDGFDPDPAWLYSYGSPELAARIRSEIEDPRGVQQQEQLAADLAARHWTLMAVAAGYMDTFLTGGVEQSTAQRIATGNIDHARTALANLAGLQQAAAVTGGSVVTDVGKLATAVTGLGDRVRLTYQLARAADRKTHTVEVKTTRAGLRINATHRNRIGTSDELAAARARSLLLNEAEPGEIAVRCRLTNLQDVAGGGRSATLTVDAETGVLSALRELLPRTQLRYSVAVELPNVQPFVRQDLVAFDDFGSKPGFSYDIPMTFKRGSTRLAVVVEEMSSGAWGSCTAPLDGTAAAVAAPSGIGVAPAVPEGWLTSLDEAVARARQEQKLILLQLHGSCERCNEAAEGLVKDAGTHEGLARSFSELVLMRAETSQEPGETLGRLLKSIGSPEAGLYLLDPDGGYILRFSDYNAEVISNSLAALRGQTAVIVSAAAKRAAGQTEDADMELGGALLVAQQQKRAMELFEGARGRAEAKGDAEKVQLAQLMTARGWASSGALGKAYEIAKGIAAKPATKFTEAAAYLVMGAADRAANHIREAVVAFRKAYEAAPPASELEAAAKNFLARLDTQPLPPKAAAPSILQLILPRGEALVGTVEIGIIPAAGHVRVDLFLDQLRVAQLGQGGKQRVELGQSVRSHNIRAIAFDAAGKVAGEAEGVINRGTQSFAVKITSPAESAVSGTVRLIAEATAPPPHRITRVDFFWNEHPIGTAAAPPYETRYTLPAAEPAGYLRALAVLDDGRTAEDVHLVNAGGVVADSKVQQVELYASVLDRRGRPVPGLAQPNFEITDDGAPVKAVIHDASADPMTLGIAIDTSGSMAKRILELQEAASRFLRETMKPEDRAFLVSFDVTPKLLHPLSSDVKSLTGKLFNIYASGDTSIYDALVFSLQQFQGVGGKKGLIVFTDGIESRSADTAAAAAHLARQSGVPVFIVVLGENAPRPIAYSGRLPTGRISTVMTNKDRALTGLRAVADNSGGELTFAAREGAFTNLFELVRTRLESEYLLTWPAPPGKPGRWRKVGIALRGTSGTVRAATGYYEE